MEGGYTPDGRINGEANDFLAPVSIHPPQRIDAIEALDRCTEVGAVLVKQEALSLLRVNRLCPTDGERKKTPNPVICPLIALIIRLNE